MRVYKVKLNKMGGIARKNDAMKLNISRDNSNFLSFDLN